MSSLYWKRIETLLSTTEVQKNQPSSGSDPVPTSHRRTTVMKVQQPLMSQTSQRDPLKAFNIHQIKEFADISLIAPRGSLEAAPGRMLHISVAAAGGLA